ncbi:MAG: Asp-tRNA(Asn)/Glu-tRNA(Gln) amidotransferase subunit GatA [Clostridia bacterium]|nr:Asp-tRNA(Asn)/Glu-tRNA(Gln) amidotransferase subunit GatA [Clostridia bacterium]
MKFEELSLQELVEGITSQKFLSESVVKYFIEQCEKHSDLNAIIEVFDDAIAKAKALDEKIARCEKVGKLAGVPVAIKDIIACKGKKMTCASKFMKDYESPYSATIIKKLEAEDAIIFARTNMDEFAMGSSCENSCYGACKNSHDQTRVSGGSSGGSAVAVASGLCPVAIGTDTGGSVRQPSSFNGVVGIKPTYGSVSRFGIVAFASSTDQAGPITKTIEDNEFILSILAGKDANDGTSIENDFISSPTKEKYTIGICKQLTEKIKQLDTYPQFESAIHAFEKMGYDIVEVDVPHIADCLACYYILTPAEATSNLARFDGVKYTIRSEEAKSLEEVYVKSRSEGFGEEVKRRIMLGNFVLSSGYFDAYYKKAKKLQTLLKQEFAEAFKHCDTIITPTTPGEAFEIGGKIKDPVAMYLEDLFTVPASIAGIPALSIPYAKGKTGLPLGLQLMGAQKSEKTLYDIAKKFKQGGAQ